ncbi:MAG: DNA methylase [Treponema sp.]|nr:DNA methylase [Treponema sp.]
MTTNWEKTYIAIDLKSFYASVECVERGLNPLTTNLVVADASRTEKTICLAVTPSLKAYGLSGRSRLFEVVQKAKEIKSRTGKELEYITAVPRMALYIQYSADIYEVYLKYFSADDIHVYSIDEVFIDATSYLKFYNTDARSLCQKVIQDILAKTGITATAGIAPNLFLCKVAMDIVAKHIPADKNGVRIAEIDEMEFRRTLWNHKPLTDFWRIGPGISRRLENAYMHTMGDIARRSLSKDGLEQLYEIFGIDAEILIDHAWGYEPCTIKHIKGYHSEATSLGSGQVLHCPYDWEKARLIVKEMTELLVLDMVDKGICSDTFVLMIGYDASSIDDNYKGVVDTDRYGRQIPKPVHGTAALGVQTNLISKVMAGVLEVYDRIIDKRLLVRRINITAGNVIPENEVQATLFDDCLEDEKEKSIQNAILGIQKKFGKNSLLKAHNLEEGATTLDRNKQIGGHRA